MAWLGRALRTNVEFVAVVQSIVGMVAAIVLSLIFGREVDLFFLLLMGLVGFAAPRINSYGIQAISGREDVFKKYLYAIYLGMIFGVGLGCAERDGNSIMYLAYVFTGGTVYALLAYGEPRVNRPCLSYQSQFRAEHHDEVIATTSMRYFPLKVLLPSILILYVGQGGGQQFITANESFGLAVAFGLAYTPYALPPNAPGFWRFVSGALKGVLSLAVLLLLTMRFG